DRRRPQGAPAGGVVPYRRAACRQTSPDDLDGDGTPSRCERAARNGEEGGSVTCRSAHSRRNAWRPVAVFVRQGEGRRRSADWRQRACDVSALGRHRFAGGRVAHDEAWVPRELRALPQLSRALTRVAGKGRRTGGAAHEVATAI